MSNNFKRHPAPIGDHDRCPILSAVSLCSTAAQQTLSIESYAVLNDILS